MEIRVNKLQEVFELVKPAVPKKPTLKAVSYLYLGEGKALRPTWKRWLSPTCPKSKTRCYCHFLPSPQC